jgi:hypothetical protein
MNPPRSWFEFEYLLPPPYGIPGWRRSKFSYFPQTFGISTEPGGGDEALAHEMLIIQSKRYRPGTKFRLVRVTEEVVGEQVSSPEFMEG